MPITTLPTTPDPSDPSTFAARMDALIAALPGFVTEVNALAAALGVDATGVLASGMGDFLLTPSSANLRATLTDETGTGSAVFATGAALSGPTITNMILVGTPVEDIYALSGTTPALEPDNGAWQTWTLTGNSTPTDAFSAGQAVLLMIDDGTAYSVTWPSVTWLTTTGSAPILATSGYTPVLLFKIGSVLYGKY